MCVSCVSVCVWWTTSFQCVLKLCFLSYNDIVRYILPALGEVYQGNSGLSKLPFLSFSLFSPSLPPSIRSLVPSQLVERSRCAGGLGQEKEREREMGWDRNSHPPCDRLHCPRPFWQAFRHIHSNNYAQQQWSLSSQQGPIVYMPVRVSVCVFVSVCVCACIWRQSKAKNNILLEIWCWYLAGLFTRGLGQAWGYCSLSVSGEKEINKNLRVMTNSEAAVCQHPSFFCRFSVSGIQKQIIKFDWHTSTPRWREPTMAQNYSTYCTRWLTHVLYTQHVAMCIALIEWVSKKETSQPNTRDELESLLLLEQFSHKLTLYKKFIRVLFTAVQLHCLVLKSATRWNIYQTHTHKTKSMTEQTNEWDNSSFLTKSLNYSVSTHREAAKVFSSQSVCRANTEYVFENGSNKSCTVENNACLPERRKA